MTVAKTRRRVVKTVGKTVDRLADRIAQCSISPFVVSDAQRPAVLADLKTRGYHLMTKRGECMCQ